MIAFASTITFLFTIDNLPQQLAAFTKAITSNPLVFNLLVALVLFIVGTAMESNAAYIMLVPLFHPIAMEFGLDPLHFGFLFVFNLVIGMLTPPVAVVLMVVQGVSKVENQAVHEGGLAVRLGSVRRAAAVHAVPADRDMAAASHGVLSHAAHRHAHAFVEHGAGTGHRRAAGRRSGRFGPFQPIQGDGNHPEPRPLWRSSPRPRSCTRPNCWRVPRSMSLPGTAPRPAGSASRATFS